MIYGLELSTWIILIMGFSLLCAISVGVIKYHSLRPFLIGLLGLIVGFIYFKFKLSFYPTLLLYLITPSIISGLLIGLSIYERPATPIKDVEFFTNKGKRIIRDVFRGVSIFGASGSGKTSSIIYTLLQHFAKNKFSGLIYDYKDGELTEMCIPLFQERLKIISIHRHDIGVRVNPLAPRFLKDEKDVIEVSRVIISNLQGGSKEKNFFSETAESLLRAIILRFSMDYPQYCTLPHMIAFILSVDFSLKVEDPNLGIDKYKTFEGLRIFLVENKRVRMQSASFLLGLDSEKQTAGVVSSLANALTNLVIPDAFWTLSADELDLDINNPSNDKVVAVMGEPKNESAFTPLLAMIIHTITKQMMQRNCPPSFLLLDEAPTIKLQNMARIPATMRSFNVATVYCAQDIVQGIQQYTKDGFKAIITNLSTQFFGKANDPDTANYYEGYFEKKMEKTKSTTRKGVGDILSSGESSTTTGQREVAKVRANEFMKLKVGEFAFLSDGKSEILKFRKPNFEIQPINKQDCKMENIIISNMNEILADMELFASSIGVSQG